MRSRTRLLVWLGIGLVACGIGDDEEPPPPGMLYVSRGGSEAIHALHPATGSLTPLIDLPLTSAFSFVVAPRDPILVINAGPLYRFDLRTRQLAEIVNGDRFHANFAVSESGTLLAYRNSEPRGFVLRIRAIGTDDDILVPGLQAWESIFELQWLGDTALIFLREDEIGALHAWRVRVDGSGLEPVGEPVGARIVGMSVDPSSRYMALLRSPNFGSDGPGELSIVDLASLEERFVATLENWSSPRVAWSPDGRFVAGFIRRPQATADVVLIDTRSGAFRFLTTESLHESLVAWSAE
jgi:hypothetical protein